MKETETNPVSIEVNEPKGLIRDPFLAHTLALGTKELEEEMLETIALIRQKARENDEKTLAYYKNQLTRQVSKLQKLIADITDAEDFIKTTRGY